MSRLPVPGSDDDIWGNILNDYLSVELNKDGTLKKAGDIADAKAKADTAVQTVNGKPGPTVTLTAADVGAVDKLADLTDVDVTGVADQQILTFDASTSQWHAATASTAAPAATNASEGIVQLAGDLGGSNDASAPVISSGAITDAKVSATADIAQSKIANLTADLAAKANTADLATVATSGSYTDLTDKPTIPTLSDATTSSKGVVQLAGDLGGSNDASAPIISDGAITDSKVAATANIAQSKIADLTTDLAAKANSADLAAVATSGSYTDLTNQPAIPTLNDLLPDQTGQAGKVLQTDGTNTAWAAPSSDQDIYALTWMEVGA
jgi:hypothetical protein